MSELAISQVNTAKSTAPKAEKSEAPKDGFSSILSEMISEETAPQTKPGNAEMDETTEGKAEAMALLAGMLLGQNTFQVPATSDEAAEILYAMNTEGVIELGDILGEIPIVEAYMEYVADPAAAEDSITPEVIQFSSLLEARQGMADIDDELEIPEASIAELQMNADLSRATMEGIAEQSALPEANPVDIMEQLRTGIMENLERGHEEFVMKLKPEGLGEITVRMAEQDGKILLSILASSDQVVKALSQDISALQNALHPLQAQVQEIAVTENFAALTHEQLGHHNQDHRPGQQHATKDFWQNMDSHPEAVEAGPARVYDSALNAYI